MKDKVLRYKYNLIKRDERILCIFPDKPFWFIADKSIEILLEYFSGSLELESLEEQLINQFNYSNQEVKEVLEDLDSLFNAAELFELIESKYVDPFTVKEVFTIPVLNITKNCNLACKHCYADAQYKLEECDTNELTTEEWMKVIDDIVELISKRGEDRILLTGGEPFLRHDIFEIIAHIKSHGFRPVINTNSLLIKSEDIPKLRDSNAELLVSLDGASIETHEFLRGKNTFYKTLSKIRELRQYDIITRMSFTVHERNFDELSAIFELASELGISEVAINNLNVLSRATCSNISRVDVTKVNEELKRLSMSSNIDTKLLESTDFANLGAILLENLKFTYCGIGAGSLCIDSDGTVYPCYNTMTDEFKIGNVKNTDIDKIWRDSKQLNELRLLNIDTMNDKCKKCIVRYYCGGGCRGEAHFFTGDINAPYPFCEDQKKSIIDMMFIATFDNEIFSKRVNFFNGLKKKFITQ